MLANTKENSRLAFRHVSPGTQKADTHAPVLNTHALVPNKEVGHMIGIT